MQFFHRSVFNGIISEPEIGDGEETCNLIQIKGFIFYGIKNFALFLNSRFNPFPDEFFLVGLPVYDSTCNSQYYHKQENGKYQPSLPGWPGFFVTFIYSLHIPKKTITVPFFGI